MRGAVMSDTQGVDSSWLTHLAYCTCGWRELATDRNDGWARAAAHAEGVHGGAGRSGYTYRMRRRRGE